MRHGKPVASFDSTTGMLRALARFLDGRDTPLIGQADGALEAPALALLAGANRLPLRAKQFLYAASGWSEAIPAAKAAEVRSSDLARHVIDHYPRRRYPVVFVGSSNGALVHLAAALGAPWLPQTLLIPVRRRKGHPDDATADLHHLQPSGEALLAANPDLTLHHMHDANQDRLMIAGMSYFRVKWHRLPEVYREFLTSSLAPGAALVVVECTQDWPTTRVGERYLFQHGALGGATPDEFRYGSGRVTEYLARLGSPYTRWPAPEPDGRSPEAEWGFDPALLADLEELADQKGWHLSRLRFSNPEHLSFAVADLYRRWYADRGIPTNRLLVESFLLVEPWWTLRSGSVPYWMVFNTDPSHTALSDYLDASDPYDEIRMTLFSHGVNSVGLAPIESWQRAIGRARKVGSFVGVDPDAYPRDFAVFARAHRALSRIRARYPMPIPLTLAAAHHLVQEDAGRHNIAWDLGRQK
jgi:hypothetical protein